MNQQELLDLVRRGVVWKDDWNDWWHVGKNKRLNRTMMLSLQDQGLIAKGRDGMVRLTRSAVSRHD